jgi:hypothetical protein
MRLRKFVSFLKKKIQNKTKENKYIYIYKFWLHLYIRSPWHGVKRSVPSILIRWGWLEFLARLHRDSRPVQRTCIGISKSDGCSSWSLFRGRAWIHLNILKKRRKNLAWKKSIPFFTEEKISLHKESPLTTRNQGTESLSNPVKLF